MNIAEMKDDYDWKEAFSYATNIRTATGCEASPFGIDDVDQIINFSTGENDGPSWIMVGKLKDGRFFFLSAGCDYTGWDCQAGGDAQVADTLENLHRFGMDEDGRERFGIKLAD